MKRTLVVAVSLLSVFVGIASAQNEAIADVPTKEDVSHFLDVLQVKTQMVRMLDAMKTNMKASAEAAMKQNLPGASPEELAKADRLADDMFKEFPVDEMIDAMIPIYQRHLTKNDLESIVAFYSSPTGQKLLQEQPAMMAEGMKAAQGIVLKKLPALTQRLNEEVARLAREESGKKHSVVTNQ